MHDSTTEVANLQTTTKVAKPDVPVPAVKPEMAAEVQIGEVVNYVPHECHAMEDSVQGRFPFAMGRRRTERHPRRGSAPSDGTVEELEGKDLDDHLRAMKNQPVEQRNLVLIHPQVTFDAVVRGIHKEGPFTFLDLDISHHRTGITLNYDRVPLVTAKSTTDLKWAKPHTCFRKAAPQS